MRGRDSNSTAIHFVREGVPEIENVTWQQLRQRVETLYSAMISAGVKEGDRIGAVISNSVDAIVICLASLAIGAIFSSASPDLGSKAIVDRFTQIRPKLIFADNAYMYDGKLHHLGQRIGEWSHILTGDGQIDHVVIIPYCPVPFPIQNISMGISWDAFVGLGIRQMLTFNFLPFTHPAFILYSSGTVSSGVLTK